MQQDEPTLPRTSNPRAPTSNTGPSGHRDRGDDKEHPVEIDRDVTNDSTTERAEEGNKKQLRHTRTPTLVMTRPPAQPMARAPTVDTPRQEDPTTEMTHSNQPPLTTQITWLIRNPASPRNENSRILITWN